jgi:hypothetical protein
MDGSCVQTLAGLFAGERAGLFLRRGQNAVALALAGSSKGTKAFSAVPFISMQRQVEGRCGTEFGPLCIS